MSGICSAHPGPCPWDCHIAGERKILRNALTTFVEDDERVYGEGHTDRSVRGREALNIEPTLGVRDEVYRDFFRVLLEAHKLIAPNPNGNCWLCDHSVEVCDCGIAKLRSAIRFFDEA